MRHQRQSDSLAPDEGERLVRVMVNLPRWQVDALERIAQRGLPRSEVLRRLLTLALKTQEGGAP